MPLTCPFFVRSTIVLRPFYDRAVHRNLAVRVHKVDGRIEVALDVDLQSVAYPEIDRRKPVDDPPVNCAAAVGRRVCQRDARLADLGLRTTKRQLDARLIE